MVATPLGELGLTHVPGAHRVTLPGIGSAVFTFRDGPVAGTLGGTNLSWTHGDDPDAVGAARDWAADLVGVPSARTVWGRQVHGAGVVVVDADILRAHPGDRPAPVPDTDAVVTALPGTGAGVLTADCVPLVLFADGAVAAIHSGWGGYLAGVVEAGLGALRSLVGDADVVAVIGPSIGACCFEVGDDVAARFDPSLVVHHHGRPKPHIDLRAGVAATLAAGGVACAVPLFPCTRCSPSLFSHRRGETGRQGVIVARSATPAGAADVGRVGPT